MRVVRNSQPRIGEVAISPIKFDPSSRDDIPRILSGLQHRYLNPSPRAKLFQLLEEAISPKVDKGHGRPGMERWKILVCGVLRLDLNEDYDRLHELVNQHNKIRERLGHGQFDRAPYSFQTLKDNVCLLTPDLMDKSNQMGVSAAPVLVKQEAQRDLDQARDTLQMLEQRGVASELAIALKIEIESHRHHAKRQLDQTKRRVILGETLPHAEKVFSIFEPHTQWLGKGKAGVPVEWGWPRAMGVTVWVLEDPHPFILHHQVMAKKTDDQVTASMVGEAPALSG